MNPAEEFILRYDSLEFSYQKKTVFSYRPFALKKNETVLLTGPSGFGKTTLLHLIAGLKRPRKQTGHLLGHDLSHITEGQHRHLRAQKMGLIYQELNLIPYLSVQENILLPMLVGQADHNSTTTRLHSLTKGLGLQDYLLKQAKNLSLGEQQRVAQARALILNPPLILADEPTSALDAKNKDLFLKLLQEERQGASVLMISHDQSLSSHFDRVIAIEDLLEKKGE